MVIAGVIVFIIVVVIYLSSSTTSNFSNVSNDKLRDYIEALFYRGADNAFLIIKKKHKKEFVQLSKDIVKKGVVDILFSYPKATWSEPYYENVKKILTEYDIDFSLSEVTDQSPLEFIEANFHDNLDTLTEIIESIFNNIYKINCEVKYKMKFNLLNPHNVKIGFE